MLEIRFLGEQSVVDDGANVTAAQSSRALMLLAQLVLHPGEALSRGHLASLFWPESSDEQALTNLRRELHTLRRGLPHSERCLVAETRTLLWTPDSDVSCDVTTFQRAANQARVAAESNDLEALAAASNEAVTSYRGDLLPAHYEDWVLEERDQLRRRCVEFLDLLIENAAAHDDVGSGVDLARRRTELEPLEDGGYRTLMKLQARSGNRAAALHTYHRCVSMLERELGVSPDPMTTALYEEFAPTGTTARESVTDEAVIAIAPSVGGGHLPLVGRKNQLDALRQRWEQACAGQGGLHVVNGESGVGKSRLISELAKEAERQGAVVARARCFAGRARLAMAPVAEWLGSEALVRQRDRLDQVWAAEVDRLVPSTPTPRERLQPMVDAWQRHRFFEGLARAVLDSGRPTLLILDDLQWCDADTMTWLQLLFRLADGSPLLVLASARTEDADLNPPVTHALRALSRDGLMSVTELEPLTPEQTAELAELLDIGDDVGAVHAATGGYPLFVIESSRARIGTTGTKSVGQLPRVHAVLADRLDQLGSDAHDTVHLAAIVGRDFSLELLTEASDLPPDSVVTAVDELWRRRIVTQHSRATYDFVHDLLRDAALEEITPPRQMLLHRRVAQAMELLHASEPAAFAAAIADHYDQAQLTSRALQFHVLAAETAVGLFANADAVHHYERAIELVTSLPASSTRDRQELDIRLAMSAPINALFGYASTRLQAALDLAGGLAERLDDERQQALTLVGLFAVRFVQGHIQESYSIGERALVLSANHPEVIGQAHFAIAGGATSLGRLEEAIAHFEVVPELTMPYPPALVGTRPEVHARAWSGHAFWLAGRTQESAHWTNWAIDRAKEVDHPYSLAVALAYATLAAQFNGDRTAVRDLSEQTMALCTRYGFAYYGEWGQILSGWSIGGDVGIAAIDAGLRKLNDQGAKTRRPYYLWLLASALEGSGDADQARRVLDEATQLARTSHDVWWLPELLRFRARLSTGTARQRLVDQAVEVAESHGSTQLGQRARGDGGRTFAERSPT